MERSRSPSSSSDEWSVVDEDSIEYNSDRGGSENSSAESTHLDETNQRKSPSPVILDNATISLLLTFHAAGQEESAESKTDTESDREEVEGVKEEKDLAVEDAQKLSDSAAAEATEGDIAVVGDESETTEAKSDLRLNDPDAISEQVERDVVTEECENDSVSTEVVSLSSDSDAEDVSSDNSEMEIIRESEVVNDPAIRYFMNPEKAKESFIKTQERKEGTGSVLGVLVAGIFIGMITSMECFTKPATEKGTINSEDPGARSQCDLLRNLRTIYGFDASNMPTEHQARLYLERFGFRIQGTWHIASEEQSMNNLRSLYEQLFVLCQSNERTVGTVDVDTVMQAYEELLRLAGKMHALVIDDLKDTLSDAQDALTQVKEMNELLKKEAAEINMSKDRKDENKDSPRNVDGDAKTEIREALLDLSSILKRNVPKIAKEFRVQLNTHLRTVADRIRAKSDKFTSFFSAENLQKAFDELKRTMNQKESDEEPTCHEKERPTSIKPCQQHALIPSKGVEQVAPIPTSTPEAVPCHTNELKQPQKNLAPEQIPNDDPTDWLLRRSEGRDQLRRSFEEPETDWIQRRAGVRDQLRRRSQPCVSKRKWNWSYEARAKLRSKLRRSDAGGNPFAYGYPGSHCGNVPKEHMNRECRWKTRFC
uniref:Peroxin-14 n=1 Tax=Steinernema glaseri TaxID=37863 RepID=A0A1I7ZI40_9BILA